MDFSGLLDSLERNLSALGLRYFVSVKLDGTNELTGVFLELPGGLGEWAKGGDTNTVLFDPTHGTNAYRMKLCLFTGVGQHGKTIIYAAAVLAAESQEMFRWAFRGFHNVFMVKPLSVFTDRDYNIEAVLVELALSGGIWEGTKHMYCIWHLSKNVYEHLRTLFLGENGSADWKEVHDTFWKLVKDTDVHSQETFDDRWLQLVELVKDTASNCAGDKLENGLLWLRNLGNKKKHFAACHVWGTFTSGVKSTQRAEAMQHTGFPEASRTIN